jgi:NTE family protein
MRFNLHGVGKCGLLALLAFGLFSGCAHHRLNQPLPATGATDASYYFHTRVLTNNSDDLMVVLAFSGGGTRAAAFSYGVLEELRNTKYQVDGRDRSLLQELDVISSVSGGSVTAAAYGLYGEKTFELFEDAFLNRNVQRTLLLRTVNPFRWPKLWSSTYGRSELAADYYDKILFKGATFADLNRAGGPYLVINSTDISTGARFDFTQHTFNLINSDVESYPISYAVAASSAVPGALTAITLRNYSTNGPVDMPDWIKPAAEAEKGRITRRARELKGITDGQSHPYLHVVDGGVSDNLGLAPVIDYLQSLPFSPSEQEDMKQRKSRKVVVIGVNAFSSPEKDWESKESPPGSISTAAAAASQSLERNSWNTLDLVREGFEHWREELAKQKDVKLYSIYLSFTNFKDQRDQRFFLNLPTTFFLPAADVEKLREAGSRLLRENESFNDLLRDLGAQRVVK